MISVCQTKIPQMSEYFRARSDILSGHYKNLILGHTVMSFISVLLRFCISTTTNKNGKAVWVHETTICNSVITTVLTDAEEHH